MQHHERADLTRTGLPAPVQPDAQEPLGVLIRRSRTRLGLSQDALAERLGAVCGYTSVTRAAISQWERGVRVPQPYWRGYLAAVLDIPLELLDQAAVVQAGRRPHPLGRPEASPAAAPGGGPAAGLSPARVGAAGPGLPLAVAPPGTPNIVLRAWRRARGLTRSQLAAALAQTASARQDRLACTRQLVGKWENGQVHWPTARYQLALYDLTGTTPGGLGFLGPTPRDHRGRSPARTPALPPGGSDLAAIDDLTSLAATLNARGYTTTLAATVPCLTISHPQAGQAQPITVTGAFFCWWQVPFGCRPPVMLAITADAVDVLMDLVIARSQDTR